MITLKSAHEIELMRRAGKITAAGTGNGKTRRNNPPNR